MVSTQGGASPDTETLEPVLPITPPDVLAQEVDLDKFPTFNQWKDAMWAAPFVASHQVEVNVSYKRSADTSEEEGDDFSQEKAVFIICKYYRMCSRRVVFPI
eukprot:3158758-Amphidinium_carterae.1